MYNRYVNQFIMVGVNDKIQCVDLHQSLITNTKQVVYEIDPTIEKGAYRQDINTLGPIGINWPYVAFSDKNALKQYNDKGENVNLFGGYLLLPDVPTGFAFFRVFAPRWNPIYGWDWECWFCYTHLNIVRILTDKGVPLISFNVKFRNEDGNILDYPNYDITGICLKGDKLWVCSSSGKISRLKLLYEARVAYNVEADSFVCNRLPDDFRNYGGEVVIWDRIGNVIDIEGQSNTVLSMVLNGHETVHLVSAWSPIVPTSKFNSIIRTQDTGLVEFEGEIRDPDTGELLSPNGLTVVNGMMWVSCTNGFVYEIANPLETQSDIIEVVEGFKVVHTMENFI